jgi:uncharacterized protein (TIGR00288 family)
LEQQGLQGPRIALLIDFDNVVLGVDDPPGFDAELVMNALRSRGVVVLGRAYGDWYRHNRHRRKLMEQGIELVETPAFGPVIKNSADIRIALDAFEIGMLQSHISEFCLVSGDSDFLPLIKRLQLLGKSVVVIAGNKFTSALIRQNCNEYISYENLLAESVGAQEDATTLEGAFALLQRTISTMDERGQDARSSSVKQMMLQLNPVFSERTFGCHQFKQFLDKACAKGIIGLDRRDSSSGEYQVMLLDENGNGIHEEPESAPKEKPLISDLETAPVRPKKPHTRISKPAEEPTKEEIEETKEASLDEEIVNNASTVPPSRRGRLKFSGRTWRSGGTSVKTENAVEESKTENIEEKNAAEPVAKVEEKPAATPIPETESAEKEAQKTEEAAQTEPEEKPKPKTTRRRKATTSSSKTSSKAASEAKEAKPEETETPAEEEPKKTKPAKKTAAKTSKKVKEDSSEEKPKKPTRRRRTSTKKTEEESPKTEETSAE